MKSSNIVAVSPRSLPRRRDHELAFLPAALEIVETPPSPIGRAIAATIILVFVLAVVWACFSWVDIVATAPGKIIPSGRTKLIQPFQIGVVRAIDVRDGETVKKGQALIALDPTAPEATENRLRDDLLAARLDVVRLQAALAGKKHPLAVFHVPVGASPILVATERELLVSESAAEQAKLAALGRRAAQRRADRATAAAEIAKIKALIPLLQAQVDMRKTLFEHATGSKLAYLKTLQQLVAERRELAVQQGRYSDAIAALAAIVDSRNQAIEDHRRKLLADLAKAETKAAGLAQDLIKAKQLTQLELLRAPIDGVVQQLAVHTIGGVVTPAQPLLVLVPIHNHLEIEAMVSNQDIGFVETGQKAVIKVAAFDYTRYGLLHGRVLSISRDAVGPGPNERPDRRANGSPPAANGTSNAGTADPVYAARVSLDRTRMKVGNKFVNFSPGMAVTVEIKTGERRIISYLLSPLRKYEADSIRGR